MFISILSQGLLHFIATKKDGELKALDLIFR